jgi:hypothetical protein
MSAASTGASAGAATGATPKPRPAAIALGEDGGGVAASPFSPLPVLLHELNQPLTGLQCSLELATVGSRTPQQYISVLHQSLDLVARMRMLVEAVREVSDLEPGVSSQPEAIALDFLLRGTVDDLRPVAESRKLHIDVDGNSFPHSCLVQRSVTATLFRIIDSVLSLAVSHSIVRVHLRTLDQHAAVLISWMDEKKIHEKMAENTETGRLRLSPPALGLLVARACWQRAGGQWNAEFSPANHSLTLLLPWAESNNQPPTSSCGDRS